MRSRRTRRWRSRGCCAASARAPTPTRAARSTSRCAPASSPTRSSSPGVGKTDAELAQAIDLGVRTINAESEGELRRIDALARARQTRARVALRLNPDIDAKSHPHISTGLKTNKFGIGLGQARDLCRQLVGCEGLEIVGLHIHIGSQITDLDPLARAARAIVQLARELKDDGIVIDHVDLGGGLGISYDGSPVPSAATTRPRCCRSSRALACTSSSNRAATSSRPPASCCRAWWTSRSSPAASCS
jgi:diaminopimelate decarboxylase